MEEIKKEKSLSEGNTQKVISIIKGFLVELEGRMNKRIDDKVEEVTVDETELSTLITDAVKKALEG